MKFIQCEASATTKGTQAAQLWDNARAVAKCRYDLNGKMTHG